MKAIKITSSTCQICGGYADWDESFGPSNYIICPRCMSDITEVLNKDSWDIIRIASVFGAVRELNMEKGA